MLNKKKKAQEEIVGFALIIIIVAVVLLFFLNFYIRSGEKESVESYEADSFIQAFLHYTTECEDYLEYLSVQKLIFECNNDASCLDDRKACEILNSTLKGIVDESWPIGEDRPVKGYELKITANQEEVVSFMEGNTTGNYKGAKQDFARSGDSIEILFRAYY
ncbi:hypothetical protein ES703_61045 [subsurface metagenome]